MKNYRGTTYIELIIVMSILVIVVAASSPFITRFTSDNNLDIASELVVISLRKAQNNSITRKDNEMWGICYSNETILVFTGTCASPTKTDIYNIPERIKVDGFDNTYFSIDRGEPSQELNITLSGNSSSKSIYVNSLGAISTY